MTFSYDSRNGYIQITATFHTTTLVLENGIVYTATQATRTAAVSVILTDISPMVSVYLEDAIIVT